MRFARLNDDGTIAHIGSPPGSARRLDTGQWVSPPGGEWDQFLAIECGWVPTEEPEPPAFDPETEKRSYSWEVNLGRTVARKRWRVEELPAAEQQEKREERGRRDRLANGVPNNPTVNSNAALIQDLIDELARVNG